MATPVLSPIGQMRITVDGRWDIKDLLVLAESLSESYGLFYPLVAPEEVQRAKFQDWIRREFWRGDADRFPHVVYVSIPEEEKLKLRSFRYASAGYIEFSGVLLVLLLLARVARAYIKVGTELITLVKAVEDFFRKRAHLRRPTKRVELDKEMEKAIEEARMLVFEIGPQLGFEGSACDKLIEIVGNPIAALKYLLAAGKEGQKLAVLQQQGLLELPAPSAEGIMLQPARGQKPNPFGGMVQVVRRSRKRTKPPPKV